MNDKQPLQQAYSAHSFRETGHALVELLATHLERSAGQSYDRANPYTEPEPTLSFWEEDWKTAQLAGQSNDPMGLFQSVLDQSVHLHDPRYMGHQVSPPLPLAALSGLMSDMLNNGMAVYEMGAAASAIEQVVITEIGRQAGYDDDCGGVLTSGGSLGNLTALLAARRHSATSDVWMEGNTRPMALMVSEEAHYCVDRAVRLMGWGENGIIKVPVNERHEMDTTQLEPLYNQAILKGIEVVAVVGSACTTAMGAFDNLEAIADFCHNKQLWFHVDGAHGAALLFSKLHRTPLKGIERADSIVLDFHKMLLIPTITTAVLFRHKRHSFSVFAQQASYLWENDGDKEWYNLGKRTFECTKLMLSLKVYSVMRTYGLSLWEQYVNQVMANTQLFTHMLEEAPDFELARRPKVNIVCFRYKGSGVSGVGDMNAMQAFIRKKLLHHSPFYIVQTQVQGVLWLRVTLTNSQTNQAVFEALLETIHTWGESWLQDKEVTQGDL